MAVQSTLYSILSLNTNAGTNQPAPSDTFNNTVSVGSYIAGPIEVSVTSTPAAVPLSSAPATAVYHLMIAHTGVSTDPNITLDMQNTAANSSKITIVPGGRVYFFNVQVPITGTGASNWSNWKLSTASGTTTATVSLVYT